MPDNGFFYSFNDAIIKYSVGPIVVKEQSLSSSFSMYLSLSWVFYLYYDFHDIFRLLPSFYVASIMNDHFGPQFLQGGGGGAQCP